MTADAFQALMQDVRSCTLCAEFLPLGPNPILQAHPQARILIAGQAPGKRAHQSGIPFDDASGDRLRLWLGVSREVFYDPKAFAILPMGFCYPGTGKSGDLPPRTECAAAWRAKIMAQLPAVELTLVIGQYAQAYYYPSVYASLTEAVQDWRERPSNAIVLPHPSPRNNLWIRRNPWFEADLIPALQSRVAQLSAKP